MKIREIYGNKNKCIVSIIMAALCVVITLITAINPDTYTKIIEKMIGSKQFLVYTVCLWIINAITFYTIAFFATPAGEHSYGAGISGIAFSYGAVGLYILIRLFKKDKKQAVRQVSFWLLLNIAVIMLVMINPFIAGPASMIMHLVSVVVGVIYLLIRHKDIDKCFDQ